MLEFADSAVVDHRESFHSTLSHRYTQAIVLRMDYNLSPIDFPPLFHRNTFFQYQHDPNLTNTWSSNLSRFGYEKEILENELANCVIYLHSLRKRQARNERVLGATPPPTRKRRKKIQQTQRELEKEIKNKQREEAALLNNLQACRTNIYIAEGLPCTLTDDFSTVPDLTPCNTQHSCAESEATETSWNGWAEDAVVSPFEKRSSHPFFVHEVAPDEQVENPLNDCMPVGKTARGPPPLLDSLRFNDDLPVPPNTAQIFHVHSLLSPVAEEFHPQTVHNASGYDCCGVHNGSLCSADTALLNPSLRRITDAALQRNFRDFAIAAPAAPREDTSETWRDDTPVDNSRSRENSNDGQIKRRMSM